MLIIVNLCGVSIPLLIKKAIDTIQAIHPGDASLQSTQGQWQTFYQILWFIAGLATISLVSRIFSRIFLLGAGRRVEYELRNQIFAHLLKMPPAFHATHPPGELMSRMTNDVDATKFLTGGGIMLGGNTLFAYLFVIPMMLKLNWQLSVVTFLVYPLLIWVMGRISRKVRTGYREVQTVLADISTVAQENLNGMTVIQSYARETQEEKRFEALCDRYFGTYTKLIHERILLFMVLAALSGFSLWLVLLVGGAQVIQKTLDWGGFVAFMMYLEYLSWPTMALGWTISIFQQGVAALERIDDVLNTDSNIQSIHEKSDLQTPPSGAIAIHGLTFTYQNPYQKRDERIPEGNIQAKHPALDDINLVIQPGETIAFVGPVGSGKTTLLRLLPRLYDIPENTIIWGDRDISTIPLETLRKQMVLMPQVNFLFSTTIAHNIAFGKPQLLENENSEAPIIEAAQIASVHMDILNLGKQYQTLVGERGVMLSGGQRQRVALARTLMMDVPVLLLDDPFSNVDAETERRIVNMLRERKTLQDKTTLISTHRFSLVALCDRIVLMEAGKIVATGSHAELLATQPLYQKLHRLQELRESLGDWGLALDTKTETENDHTSSEVQA